MPWVRIESVDDARLNVFRGLKQRNGTRGPDFFVAEGDKLLRRVLDSGFEVASLLVADEFAPSLPADLPADAAVYVAPQTLLAEVAGYDFHRGVLTAARRRPDRIIHRTEELADMVAGPTVRLALCPDVVDPENVGSFARLAAAFGLNGLLFGSACPDPFSRRVLRVSMGAVLTTPVVQCRDLRAAADWLQQTAGVELAATVVGRQAEPLPGVRAAARMGAVFGSEGHGLDDDWIDRCRRRWTIPQTPGVDSLNVAAAAAIVFYHVCLASPAV
ncbi:MAG: TrmH family RNA methyltransferase [Planctomycetia bacterium]